MLAKNFMREENENSSIVLRYTITYIYINCRVLFIYYHLIYSLILNCFSDAPTNLDANQTNLVDWW